MPFWKPKRLPDDQKSTLSHPGRPRCAPGSPEGELDCIYCSGLHPAPPGTLGNCLGGSAPAPGPRPPAPGRLLLRYYFLPLSLYLLASSTWFLVDPHATTLVPRGRRIRKGCALCRRPREKNNVAFEFTESTYEMAWGHSRRPREKTTWSTTLLKASLASSSGSRREPKCYLEDRS